MRDKNQQRFYDFENKMLKIYLPSELNDGLSLEDARSLVTRICKDYKVTIPEVKQGTSNKIAYYKTLDHKIVLPPWAQRWVVLHEVAHALTRYSEPSHGKEFIQTWCELWARMYSLNKEELMNEARKAHLI